MMSEERKRQEVQSNLGSPKRNKLRDSMSLSAVKTKEEKEKEEEAGKNYEEYLKRIKNREYQELEKKNKGAKKEKKELFLSQKVKVKGNLRENNIQRITIHSDEILPTPEQGLPSGLKFDILNSRGDQYKQIMECKRILENSRNLMQECKDLDSKIEYTTLKPNKISEKKISSFDKVLEFLGGKNKNYSKYIGD